MRCAQYIMTLAAIALLSPAPAAGDSKWGKFEWKKGKWVRAEPKKGSPAADVAAMRDLLIGKKHAKVISAAKKILKNYPLSAYGEEAMLLAGEAELAREHYYQAFEWFEKQLARFPTGKFYQRALDREFTVAEAFLAGKKRIALKVFRLPAREEGLDILARIVEHAPGSVIARKAVMRIGDHHYNRVEYAEAIDAYDTYVELFKNDPDCEYAMLQACRATHAQFKGIDYDDTPLLEAQQRYKTFAERYVKAAGRENVAGILKEIRETRAKKMYITGDFYKRTGRPGPAAYYFQQVIEAYGETAWAGMARQALGLMGDVKAAVPATIDTTPAQFPPRRPGKYRRRFIPPPPPSEEGMQPVDATSQPADETTK